MRRFFFILIAAFSLNLAAQAQTGDAKTQTASSGAETKKRPPIFRAGKDQVMQAQKMLKIADSGKIDA